jgi:hypothetical protein
MFNGNSFREKVQEKVLKKHCSAADIRKKDKQKVLRNYLAHRADERKQDWLENVAKSKEFAKYFHQGAIPLIHPELIDFRPQIDKSRAFKSQNYVPEKQRALNASKSYREKYFVEHEKYNPKDPNKKPDYRKADKKKEIQPPLKYTQATTNSRVVGNIINSARYSHEPANEKMRTNPKFRENHRDKWM